MSQERPLSSCRLLWGRQWGLKDKGILVGEYLQGLGKIEGKEKEGGGGGKSRKQKGKKDKRKKREKEKEGKEEVKT